ncbi:MAG: sel1 repeat family protein [Phycisphaerales bacterium]|nr:sel1 repeat family protein [Phycisphaerales bacterium]
MKYFIYICFLALNSSTVFASKLPHQEHPPNKLTTEEIRLIESDPSTAFNEAVENTQSSDHSIIDDGIQTLRYLSKNGHPNASNELGVILINGDILEQDSSLGIPLLKQAADNDYSVAAANLGKVYEFGLGTDKDLPTALTWYIKASSAGDIQSTYNCGYFYENGDGLDGPDYSKAIDYYTTAVEGGNVDAMYRLALLKYDFLTLFRYELKQLKSNRMFLGKQTRRTESQDMLAGNEHREKLRKLKAREDELKFMIKSELDKKIKPDKTESLGLLNRASDSGHTMSQFELASHHYRQCEPHFLRASSTFKASPYDTISAFKWLTICEPHLISQKQLDAQLMIKTLTENMNDIELDLANTKIAEYMSESP